MLMFKETNTEALLKSSMLTNITNDVDKSEGSFTQDIVSVVANEMEQGYISLDTALELLFAQTSSDNYLTMRASEFGVDRKQGEKATMTIRFTGTNGVNIPIGTTVSTNDGLNYVTTEAKAIAAGIADIKAEAANIGSIYNVPANTIVKLPQAISGVSAVTNQSAVVNGVDVEGDDALRERLYAKTRIPVTSGNPNHYKIWALEVSGIGDAKVYPVWNGAQTVKVVVISSDKKDVNAPKVTEVYDYIESVRPIGAILTVISATPKVIDVSVTVTRNTNYSQATVDANIKASITAYLKTIAFKQSFVSQALLGNAILDSVGVTDYSNLQLNGTTSNVLVGDEEVAILGTVTFTWL
jgi:uncharacterized phage protein gp47/JayE